MCPKQDKDAEKHAMPEIPDQDVDSDDERHCFSCLSPQKNYLISLKSMVAPNARIRSWDDTWDIQYKIKMMQQDNYFSSDEFCDLPFKKQQKIVEDRFTVEQKILSLVNFCDDERGCFFADLIQKIKIYFNDLSKVQSKDILPASKDEKPILAASARRDTLKGLYDELIQSKRKLEGNVSKAIDLAPSLSPDGLFNKISTEWKPTESLLSLLEKWKDTQTTIKKPDEKTYYKNYELLSAKTGKYGILHSSAKKLIDDIIDMININYDQVTHKRKL
jgi:hypothetical protein